MPDNERKAPRWEDEEMKWTLPDIEKIHCKDCILREPDRHPIDDFTIEGATLAICQVYKSKPTGILFQNEKCPYHIGEDD